MAATNPSLSVTIFLLLLGLSLSFPDGVNLKGPIKTVVVLVMENRSFDHMLGWMKRLNPKIEGVTGEECNPRSTSHPDADLICFKDGAEFVDPDPGHSYQAVKEQVFGTLNATGSNSVPSMNGFVQQAFAIGADDLPEKVMQGFGPDSIPVYKTLVEEFAVFDRWFSSLPGPTQPNRMFLYSATSHGAISHVKRELAKGYPQKSIFDSIYESGLDFGVYYQSFPTTLFLRNMRRLKYVSKFHMYDLKFKRDANNGKLPNMCVIEPRYFDLKIIEANDDHPSHDVSNGQRLVKEVYETLRSSPQWNETLLIITYDEHGGFFDHVPTPTENVPSPDGNTGPPPDFFKFDRLGVRIPTLMVSPWIKKGTVVGRPNGPTKSSEYEHSSVAATIQKLFHLNSNFLTHRDAWAGTFEHILEDLQEPRTECPEVLPDVPNSLRRSEAKEDAKLSEFQSELVHLAAVLNGDRFLSRFPDDIGSRMTVKEASEYVNGAVSRFMEASKEALKLGANGSAIVDMRSSLTTRKKLP